MTFEETVEKSFELIIRLSSGVKFTVSLPSPENDTEQVVTVSHVKQAIQRKHPETPVSSQKLIYKGRILENSKTLKNYGIVAQCTLFLVVSSASQTPQVTRQSPTGITANATTSNSTTTTSGPRPPSGSMASLMQSIMGGDDGSSSSSTNSHLQQMLNDPGAMRQAMELMRNPNALQQAMRQQDLAMSQLENMPGGFNALRSMYNSVSSMEDDLILPLQSSQSTSAGTNNNASSNQQQNTAGATGTAMPNPWGSGNAGRSGSRLGATVRGSPSPFGIGGSGGGGGGDMDAMVQAIMGGIAPAAGSNNRIVNRDMLTAALAGANENAQAAQGTPSSAVSVQRQQQQQTQLPVPGRGSGDETMIEMMRQLTQNSSLGMRFNPTTMSDQENPWVSNTNNSNNSISISTSPTLPLHNNSLLGDSTSSHLPVPSSPLDLTARFQQQLQSLRDMGFDHEGRNNQALSAVGGDLDRAVDWLLSHPTLPADEQSSLTTTAAVAVEEAVDDDAKSGDTAADTHDEKCAE